MLRLKVEAFDRFLAGLAGSCKPRMICIVAVGNGDLQGYLTIVAIGRGANLFLDMKTEGT